MKQTVSIPATDINVVSKPSAVTIWLNRESLLFSSVLEESVSNRQKKVSKICGLKNNPHLCSDLHIGQADSTANTAVGIFYAYGLSYSSVPCGALMRPLPVQGGDQRGAELFCFLPVIINILFHFK